MTKNILFRNSLFLIFTFFTCISNAQTFQYADVIKSVGFDEALDIASDPEGNVYVAGQIEFDADFGNNIILTSAGKHDIFLAKYDPNGSLVWAKRAGGKGGDKIHSVALDGMGHIFCVGEFEDTSYWDGIMKHTPGMGINDMFIAKYDTAGHAIWVRMVHGDITGPLQTRGYGVSCDAQGNVYACGGTNGEAFFEGNYLFTTEGDYDATVIKLTPDGDFCWAKRMGGSDSDKAYGIANDNNGHVYVTGYFAGHANFASAANLNSGGHTDAFLVKFDTSGVLQWAIAAGDTGFERGKDITININGQIVITGELQTGNFAGQMAYGRGNEDMYIAAFNPDGSLGWVTPGGSEEDDMGRGVTHDANGNLYVIGDYASTGHFPPFTITSNGYADVFFVKYNSTGTSVDWVRSIGGPENDRGQGIGADMSGNIYACGMFVGASAFDAINLTGDSLLDNFVAKIGLGHFCSTQVSIASQNTCNGLCDGSAIATVNGQGPFTYSWNTSPVQNTDSATGLCAGNYIVTTTDALGCTSTNTITINEPPPLVVSTSHSNVNCFQSCDGTAAVNATGQAPFTFEWSTTPMETDSVIHNICAGTYEVTITDAAGCTTSESVTITEPDPLEMTTNIDGASCIGCSDGSIDLEVNGGTSAYTYLWSNGETTEDLSNIHAGNYSVCVMDANNCTLCDTFTVVEPGIGIAENAEIEFSIYPNPVKDFAKITTQLPGTKTFSILNITGEILFQTKFSGNEYVFKTEGISSGIYFIRLYDEMGNRMRVVPINVE